MYKAFAGHAADITGVRFGPNDSHVFTTGGGDHALFQWALEVREREPAPADWTRHVVLYD